MWLIEIFTQCMLTPVFPLCCEASLSPSTYVVSLFFFRILLRFSCKINLLVGFVTTLHWCSQRLEMHNKPRAVLLFPLFCIFRTVLSHCNLVPSFLLTRMTVWKYTNIHEMWNKCWWLPGIFFSSLYYESGENAQDVKIWMKVKQKCCEEKEER